jgi:hypothetical protein
MMKLVATCPICGKPTAEATRPFCSARCSEIDLGRWFGEGYRVPVTDSPDDEEIDETG